MEWKRAIEGFGAMGTKGRYRIRGPIMGKKMYWVYLNSSRITLTGSYEDVLNFPSVSKAKKFLEEYDNS